LTFFKLNHKSLSCYFNTQPRYANGEILGYKPPQEQYMNTEESLYAKMRAKARFDVNLKAMYFIREQGAQHQECRISNISSSGATVNFARNESFKRGAVILMDIAIPNTIMHIPAEAVIMWIKQSPNKLIGGIKFTDILSDSMIRQLVKRNPEISLAFQ
jgi:hypothetical protein